MDRATRAVSSDGALRAVMVDVTDTAEEAAVRHGVRGATEIALRRAIACVAAAALPEKEGLRLTVQWSGRGPFGSIVAELRPPGDLRAYVSHADAAPETVAEGFGAGGVLTLFRQQGIGGFSQGQVPLADREVDGDLEACLARSEQVPSRLRAVLVGRKTTALLLQTLPGGDPRALAALGADWHARRFDPFDLDRLVPGARFEVISEHPLQFRCTCSRERIEGAVALLGAAELHAMARAKEGTEVRCEFCATNWVLSPGDVARVASGLD